MKHDIFISYRRDGGEHLAGRIMDALKNRGFSVFMDVEDLKSGKFDSALLLKIEEATDVIVILTPGCLDRCKNDNDWLRQEIRHALNRERNIVPIIARGFAMPRAEDLPTDIRPLATYHGLTPTHEMFDASINRLSSKFLQSQCEKTTDRVAPIPVQQTVLLLRTRVGDSRAQLRDRAASTDSRAESNLLLRVERILTEEILDCSKLTQIDADIADAERLLRDGKSKEAIPVFASIQTSLEILLQRIQLEEIRQHARAYADTASAEYARKSLPKPVEWDSAWNILCDAEANLSTQAIDPAARQFRVAEASFKTLLEDLPHYLAHLSRAEATALETQIRRLREGYRTETLPAFESARIEFADGEDHLQAHNFQRALGHYDKARALLQRALAEEIRLDEERQADREASLKLVQSIETKAISLLNDCQSAKISDILGLSLYTHYVKSGRQKYAERDFKGALSEYIVADKVLLCAIDESHASKAQLEFDRLNDGSDSSSIAIAPKGAPKPLEVRDAIRDISKGRKCLREQLFTGARDYFCAATEALERAKKTKLRELQLRSEASKSKEAIVVHENYCREQHLPLGEAYGRINELLESGNKQLLSRLFPQARATFSLASRLLPELSTEARNAIDAMQRMSKLENEADAKRIELNRFLQETSLPGSAQHTGAETALADGRFYAQNGVFHQAADCFRRASFEYSNAMQKALTDSNRLAMVVAVEKETIRLKQNWMARANLWGQSDMEIAHEQQQIERAKQFLENGNYDEAEAAFQETRKHLQKHLESPSRAPVGWVICDPTPGAGHWAKEVVDPLTKIRFRLVEPGTFLMGSSETLPDEKQVAVDSHSSVTRNSSFEKPSRLSLKTEIQIAVGRFFNRRTDQFHEKATIIPTDSNMQPQHEVAIPKPFYLATTPTTESQWKQMSRLSKSSKPSRFAVFESGFAAFEDALKTITGLPKVYVGWREALAYCKRFGYRLPAEAEWEYACRAGTTTPTYGPVDAIAWHSGNCGGTLHNVAEKQSNSWGFFDMLGNVFEWCADEYFKDSPAEVSQTSPFVQSDSGLVDLSESKSYAKRTRVRRGCSHQTNPRNVQASARERAPMDTKAPDTGFRCVKEL